MVAGDGSLIGSSNTYYTYDENRNLSETKRVETGYYQNSGPSVSTSIFKYTYDLAHPTIDLHTTGNYRNLFDDYPKYYKTKTEITAINPDGTVLHSKSLTSTAYNNFGLPETEKQKFYNGGVLTSETDIKYEYENAE